jgi:stress response protein SCP2
MPIDLQKIDRGARVDLTKGNPGLDKITIGLKWNSGVVKQDVSAQNSDQKRRGGFLGALGSLVSQGVNEVERAVEGAVKIDLDTSVFEMDESGKIISRIYFGEQSNRNGSIQLSGDDRTGKNKTTTEDNEQMWLSLSNINPAASKIHIWSNV